MKSDFCSRPMRWAVVAAFATAMAWVESAVVFYLRTFIDRIEPYQPHPLPLVASLGSVELVREAATLLMLLTVGLLAGQSARSRIGYAAIAFGIWDIFYYVFLKVMCGWPRTLWDWDILFLLPLPWWGPVLAPLLISALMIAWGTLATSPNPVPSPAPMAGLVWVLNGLGICLALYVFMADAIRVAPQGVEAVRESLPLRFAWGPFILALCLMAAPVVRLLWIRARAESRR